MAATVRDLAGPHPENQRKRTELRGARNALIGVLLIAAGFAVAVAFGVGSPWTSGRGSGVLLAFLGGTPAVAAVLLLVHHGRARAVALAASLLAIAWSGSQIVRLDDVTWFHGAMLGLGVLEALLVAGCTPRDDGRRKKMRGRR